MKVCFIGNSGHAFQAFDEIADLPGISFCGFAPGSPQEAVSAFWKEQMPVYESYEQMLDELHPDLAIVSPIFGLTGAVIMACASRKIDVFAEKPVAATIAELDLVEKKVASSGIRFCAMHYLRYTPSFYRAKEIVEQGLVGEIRMITAQKSYRYGTRPGWYQDETLYPGTIPWVGIHAIDWIYYFTGKKYRTVKALQWGKPEMAALCQFEMDDGVMASANIDFLRPQSAPTHGDDRVRIVGTRGVMEVWEDRLELIDENGLVTEKPQAAPKLTRLFVQGGQPLSAQEIFDLTRVSLLARQSAQTGVCLAIQSVQKEEER